MFRNIFGKNVRGLKTCCVWTKTEKNTCEIFPKMCFFSVLRVTTISCKGKGKGRILVIALLTWVGDQKRFTISEVAADWHELMIPQRSMRPSIARVSEQLDPGCAASRHTTAPNQPHYFVLMKMMRWDIPGAATSAERVETRQTRKSNIISSA